jgi:hypothetical protein
MSRRLRRILISLGAIVLLCVLYAWFFGLQTMALFETRKLARRAPIVKETPRPLPDTSISWPPGTKLSYFGYEFEVPWSDLDDPKTKRGGKNVVLTFRSGRLLRVGIAQPREFVNTILEQINPQSFRQFYGDLPLQSDYAMWSLIANATPEKVNLLSSQQEAVGIPMLLVIKAIAVPEESAIYSLQTDEFKGFQFGDPERHPRHIVVDLFADDGGLEFAFFGEPGQNRLEISQAEINCVVQAVRKSRQNTVHTISSQRLPPRASGSR